MCTKKKKMTVIRRKGQRFESRTNKPINKQREREKGVVKINEMQSMMLKDRNCGSKYDVLAEI